MSYRMIKEERQKRINNIHTKNCMGKGMKIKVRRKQIELVNKHKEEGKKFSISLAVAA